MVHGDDRGLIIPPRVAPLEVIIVPIAPSGKKELVLSEVAGLKEELRAAGFRFHSDERDQFTPGWKFSEW
jgi:prolyl-tRNA synthetase